MKIRYSPIVKYHDQPELTYEIDGLVIRAFYNGETDTFDFSNLPEGELLGIETSLKINPVDDAKVIGGEVFVTLLSLIDQDENSMDVLYPEWKELDDG